jgi:hypothetical protein
VGRPSHTSPQGAITCWPSSEPTSVRQIESLEGATAIEHVSSLGTSDK